jgi:hypothetical protein
LNSKWAKIFDLGKKKERKKDGRVTLIEKAEGKY